MGYQIVDIELKNGQILKKKLVLNSTYLQLDKSEVLKPNDIAVIKLHEK